MRHAIVGALPVHAQIEEEIFDPYLLEATGREDLSQEAEIEHGLTKELVQQLAGEEPAGVARHYNARR